MPFCKDHNAILHIQGMGLRLPKEDPLKIYDVNQKVMQLFDNGLLIPLTMSQVIYIYIHNFS